MRNKHKGSTFDSFLEEEGLLEEAEAAAIKRVVAYQIAQLMKRKKLNKSMVATKMRTSRAALDRLLDPENTSVTLQSLVKVAHALGRKLRVSI